MKLLTKSQEKLINSLNRRKKRKEHGLCICEGYRACKELYSFRPELIKFGLKLEDTDITEFNDIEFYSLPQNKFEKLTSTVNSQGIIFITEIPKFTTDNINVPFVVLLDRIADPGNFGTILRTCLAVGLTEIWYSAGTVDPFSDKTIRSALSAQFKLNLREFENLSDTVKELKSKGFNKFFRTEPAGGENCFKVEGLFDKSVIVFGNEASGVEEIESSIPLHIPMPGGFESLNVAQSVTVILFEAVRRKIF